MRRPVPFLAAGILVLVAACTGGGDTTPSPATPTAATETTAASPTLSPGTSPAVSPSPSPATSPARSPALAVYSSSVHPHYRVTRSLPPMPGLARRHTR